MRTLFAKILIWFWLAFAVMIAAFALLESAERERRLQMPMGHGGPLGLVTPLAEDALRREGPAGLIRVVDGLDRRALWSGAPRGAIPGVPDPPPPARGVPGPRERVYALDSTGRELRGIPTPPAVAALARAALTSTTGRVIEERQGQLRMAYRVEAPHGGRFALVALRPAPPRFLLQLQRDLWLKLGVLLAIGAIGCYALARYITAPIQRLRRAAQRLAGGDLAARVGARKAGRGDELEDLGHDFDAMAERLETGASMQRRLLRDISHELRSPLARLQIAIGILRQITTDSKAQATVERLDDEAGRMSRMIQDLLVISRLESREWTLAREQVNLSALVADLAADAAFEANTRGSTVEIGRLDPVILEGSPNLLRSAIDNVVRNAVRHTGAGTAVEIDVRTHPAVEPPFATVSVRDHGAGVLDEQLTRIFEPFYRVDDARAEGEGGAGLGLAIARRAVEEHGGSIEARLAEGGGLAVLIRLPLEDSSPAPYDTSRNSTPA